MQAADSLFVGSWQAAVYIRGVSDKLAPGGLQLCTACKLWSQAALSQAPAWSLLLLWLLLAASVAWRGCTQSLVPDLPAGAA